MPVDRVTLVLNPSSGPSRQGAPAVALCDALRAAGVAEIETVELTKGIDLEQAVKARGGVPDAVIAAGGDGTVSAVASVALTAGIPLGILPTGTLNHFAGDMGIPSEMDGAARVIAAGHLRSVDVGSVNGRTFINNSSIGIYPAMVAARERLIRRGLSKRIAMAGAVLAALWEFPNVSVRVIAERTGVVTRTPLVFIGNNVYQLSGLTAASRNSLDDGVLQVCTMTDRSRFALFRALVAAAFRNTERAPELHVATAAEARVETLRKRIAVALDGEVVVLRSPLLYSISPRALRVLAPAD